MRIAGIDAHKKVLMEVVVDASAAEEKAQQRLPVERTMSAAARRKIAAAQRAK
jgi:hypothetical protein